MTHYPKYKYSGVEWIGDVPEHWLIVPFKYQIDYQEGPGILAKDFYEDGVPLVRIGNIQQTNVDLRGCNFLSVKDVEEKWQHFRLKKNDLLISCSASTGIVSEVTEDSSGSVGYTGIIRLRPKNSDTNRLFVKWVVSGSLFFVQIDLLKTGSTIQHFGPSHLAQMIIPFPPLSEQKQIARYLDHKTAKIDSLVEKKKKLIELLKEERIAVINQAVTKGIDPNVPMKDSGTEWLGKIPEHWNIKKVKHLTTKIGSGVTPRGGSSVYLDAGIPLLRSQNIHFNGLLLDDVAYISEEIFSGMLNTEVFSGDVLMNITGASIGRCYYADESLGRANVNQHVCIVRPNDDIETEYLYLVLASNIGQTQVFNCQTGANREGLNFEQLRNFVFPYPNREERGLIIGFIEDETTRIDSIISKAEREIELLQEYRIALIDEVVTGKIDVREGKI